jgi:arylformamidase
MAEDWIDVSVPLRSGMLHWPDNPPVSIERALDMGRGDVAGEQTPKYCENNL